MSEDKQQALLRHLADLNAAVQKAVQERTAWMDAHMADFAKFQVGDPIYDGTSGRQLGIVRRLYRLHAGRPQSDVSMQIDYEYSVGAPNGDGTITHNFEDGIRENTSSRPFRIYSTKAEVLAHLRIAADWLEKG